MDHRAAQMWWRATFVRIALPVGITVALFICTTHFLALPALEEGILNAKRETAQELVLVTCALLEDYANRVASGELSLDEAKERAKARIGSLRYGPEGKDYFWINDMQPVMVMHPYRNDLVGQDISNLVDLNDKHMFLEFVKMVKENGAGFVEYAWQWKDDPGRVVPKLSYVSGFEPWGWIVGTGIYIDDVRERIGSITRNLNYAFAAILLIVLVLSTYILSRGTKTEKQRIQAELELRQSERRLTDIISFLPDATLVVDSGGKVIAWNKAMEDLTGVYAEEMIGKDGFEHALPFYGERRPLLADLVLVPSSDYDDSYSHLSYEKGRIQAESFTQRIGERGKYLSATASALYDASGNVVGAIESIRDVTAIKQAEKELRRERDFSASLVQVSPTFFVAIDPHGKTLLMNDSLLNALGYAAEEVIGVDYLQTFVPEEDQPALAEEFRKLTEQHKSTLNENRIVARDGQEILVEWHGQPCFDAEGNASHFFGVGIDITERKRHEVEMTRLRNLLKNIIDSMPSVLVGVDRDERVTQWNREAEKVTGISAEEARGNALSDVFPQLVREMARVREAIRDRETKTDQKVAQEVRGESRLADVTVYPLLSNGAEGAVIRVDDVTDRVRIEEMMIQSEKMLSVGGLAAGMAHEINNPLAGILQNLQVIRNRISSSLPKNREVAAACGTDMEAIEAYMRKRGLFHMIDSVIESGTRAAQIVANMLSFSRKGESNFVPHDIAQLLDQTVELAENDYDLKKNRDFRRIEIVREYDGDVPAVPCEKSKIQQVFLNLLKNGADAMRENEEGNPPRFVLRVLRKEDMVHVEIEDNGPGIDEATRRRVFEPFFTTKEVGVGTGLGLSVSYFIIVENHGGSLKVESDPGKGAKFVVCLPIERPPSVSVTGPVQ